MRKILFCLFMLAPALANAEMGFLVGEQDSGGMTKVCIYESYKGIWGINFPTYKYCPPTHRR